MNQNKQGEQQWNRHVWMESLDRNPFARYNPESAAADYEATRGRSDAMTELYVDANRLDEERLGRSQARQNNTVVGARQFDGDRLAWQAFLADYSRRTGGRAYVGSRYGGGVTQEIAMQNAARIDKYRRAAHLRYLAAGGTMGYNDYLRESGQHASQGGY